MRPISGGTRPDTELRPFLRGLLLSDVGLLQRAQGACSHELDAMAPEQVYEGLKRGAIGGLVLDAPDRMMLVCWQVDKPNALLTCFYREGEPTEFLSDCRKMLIRVEDMLGAQGVRCLFLGVGVANPKYRSLLTYFRRMGFVPDLVRMAKEI